MLQNGLATNAVQVIHGAGYGALAATAKVQAVNVDATGFVVDLLGESFPEQPGWKRGDLGPDRRRDQETPIPSTVGADYLTFSTMEVALSAELFTMLRGLTPHAFFYLEPGLDLIVVECEEGPTSRRKACHSRFHAKAKSYQFVLDELLLHQ